MPVPNISELEDATAGVVRKANVDGTLSSLTARIVRKKVELQFHLTPGTLDADEYKQALKSAIAAALAEVEGSPVPEPTTARKGSKSTTAKPKTKQGATPAVVKKKEKSSSKEYKSAATILSSDEGDGISEPTFSAAGGETAVLKRKDGAPASTKYTQRPQKRRKSSVDHDNSGEPSEPLEDDIAEANDAGLSGSSLSDAGPPRGEKKSGANEKQDTSRGKKKPVATHNKKAKKAIAGSGKDDETIKRLKSLVVACGVRKVWSKVFQDVEKQSMQIKKLKEILTELGMSGRPSLEQAKRIRERRELAKELEDVQSFEQATVGRSSRRSQATPDPSDSNTKSDSDDSEERAVPARRTTTARRSIMAFLGDQSDED